jgi:hypothetical protein
MKNLQAHMYKNATACVDHCCGIFRFWKGRLRQILLRVASSISVCFEVIQIVLRQFNFYANSRAI